MGTNDYAAIVRLEATRFAVQHADTNDGFCPDCGPDGGWDGAPDAAYDAAEAALGRPLGDGEQRLLCRVFLRVLRTLPPSLCERHQRGAR